jgi:hypothetical protein
MPNFPALAVMPAAPRRLDWVCPHCGATATPTDAAYACVQCFDGQSTQAKVVSSQE